MAERAKVPCNGCTLCCRSGELILLTPDDIAPPDKPYLVMQIGPPIPDGGTPYLALAQMPDGSCVYVGPEGCRIHDHAPAVCKAFDCGEFYAKRGRRQRQLLEDDHYGAALLAQGRKMHRLRIGLT